MDKDKRKTPLNRFIQRFYKRTFGSYNEWESARNLNKEVTSKMKKSEDGRREFWACRSCGKPLASDMNGRNIEIISGTGNKILVNFNQMIALCGDKNCDDRWNILEFDYDTVDVASNLEDLLANVPEGADEYELVKRKWLELDKE